VAVSGQWKCSQSSASEAVQGSGHSHGGLGGVVAVTGQWAHSHGGLGGGVAVTGQWKCSQVSASEAVQGSGHTLTEDLGVVWQSQGSGSVLRSVQVKQSQGGVLGIES